MNLLQADQSCISPTRTELIYLFIAVKCDRHSVRTVTVYPKIYLRCVFYTQRRLLGISNGERASEVWTSEQTYAK